MITHFIIYVSDQRAATELWSAILAKEPRLFVPGMTEFDLGPEAILGLMPLAGAERLLSRAVKHGDSPRAEVYLVVEDPETFHRRAIAAGAREVSPLEIRDWGHEAAYSIDPDGNVIAFARPALGHQAA